MNTAKTPRSFVNLDAIDAQYAAPVTRLVTIHREHEPQGPQQTVPLCADHLLTAESCLMVDALGVTTARPCHFCGDLS